ncbi:MAG: hypothetical protein AAFU78_11130, partial [Cyanobacteria bacterium J06633_2]
MSSPAGSLLDRFIVLYALIKRVNLGRSAAQITSAVFQTIANCFINRFIKFWDVVSQRDDL